MSNDNPSPSKGYRLPFGLKIKPARHYFTRGSISFEIEKGVLYYIVTLTNKILKVKYPRQEVKNKDHLSKLLKVKDVYELQSLEIVA